MQNTKIRSSVAVDVEDLDFVRHDVPMIEEPLEVRPVFKSNLGVWWEALVAVALVLVFWNVFRSWKVFAERTDVALPLLLAVVAIAVASITGRFAGEGSVARKLFGYVLLAVGLGLAVWALVSGPLPKSSLLTSAAVGLTIAGWSLRRLLGESSVRCLSLGILVALPMGFLDSGFLTNGLVDKLEELVGDSFLLPANCDQSVFWFTSVLADYNGVPHLPKEGGIQFLTGELQLAASFGNVFGVLVALATSLSLSVISRQSLLVALLALGTSYLWWILFRSGYCLNMAATNSLEGPLKELAMPSYAFLFLLLMVGATNQCLGAIMAPIEIDPKQYDVTALTQIYNACISFPQLGQSHPSMLIEKETIADSSMGIDNP